MPESLPFAEIAGLVAIVATLMSGAWVVGRLYLDGRQEKTENCLRLHEDFFANEMAEARKVAWFALEKNKANRPFTFSSFYANETAEERGFATTYQVLAFFYRLYTLDRYKKINRKLARKLFSYQYAHWRDQSAELIADTLRHDKDRPEIIEAFTGQNLLWLSQGAKIYNPADAEPEARRGLFTRKSS